MVPADDDGGFELAGPDHLVEREAEAVALAEPHPADPRRESLELDVLPRGIEPVVEVGVVRDQLLDLGVGAVDVLRVPGERGPAERSDPAAEEGPDVGGHEAGEIERPLHAAAERLLPDVVAVVEGGHAGVVEPEHGADVVGDGADGGGRHGVGIALAPVAPLLDGPARREIAVRRVVGRGLVGERVGADAAAKELGEDLGGVPEQADRQGRPGGDRTLDERERLVEVAGLGVEISGVETPGDPVRLALDPQQRGARHLRRERLGAAHAAESGGQDPAPREVAAVVLAGHLDEGLVGALDDALAADVDPGSGRHLAEHHQTLAVELAEVLPVGPRGHQVGVRDQDARGVRVGAEDPDRLAGLDQQGLVRLEFPEGADDGLVGLVVPGRLADAAVNHEVLGPLRDLGIEVVHQHAERRLGEPALRREAGAGRRLDRRGVDGLHGASPDGGGDTGSAHSLAMAAAKSCAVPARSTCSPPATFHSPWTMTRSTGTR